MPVPVFAAGHVPTAAELEQWSDQIDSNTAPGWTSYALSWTAATTNPTIGNSTVTAHYRRVSGGDLVIVRVSIGIGSTFSAGSGTYSWSLPVTAAANWGGSIGALYVFDSGAAPRAGGIVKLENTTTMTGVMGTSAITHASPQAWAQNDEIKFTVMYEPA